MALTIGSTHVDLRLSEKTSLDYSSVPQLPCSMQPRNMPTPDVAVWASATLPLFAKTPRSWLE
jgi:hypothetical protein